MQTLEEQMHRGINLSIIDKSEDEDEVEENIDVEVVLNQEEERIFREISNIRKMPNFEVPTLKKILIERS